MINYKDDLKTIEQIARRTARGGALTPPGFLVMTPNAIRHRKRKAKAAPNVVAPNVAPNKRQSGLKDKAARNAYQRVYMAKRRAAGSPLKCPLSPSGDSRECHRLAT